MYWVGRDFLFYSWSKMRVRAYRDDGDDDDDKAAAAAPMAAAYMYRNALRCVHLFTINGCCCCCCCSWWWVSPSQRVCM